MLRPFYTQTLSTSTFETYLERPSFDLCEVHQVHGTHVIVDRDVSENIKADGIVSYELHKPLAVKTADCLPVAVIGRTGVALLHIGWRGLAKNILANSQIERIAPRSFFVGPHITGASFQITEEFREHFPHSKNFFSVGKRDFFSLYDELRDRVQERYPHATVSDSGLCTFKNEKLHSFRRDGTTQRNWNILKYSQKRFLTRP